MQAARDRRFARHGCGALGRGTLPNAHPPVNGGSAFRLDDARLRRLFDANVVGILISNNAGAILEANDAFLSTIGYTREDLENGRVDWRRLTPPEWLPLDEQAIADMAAHGMFSPYEKEYIRKDGSRVPISLGGARIAETADEQICYIVDLSAIRRAEAALRRSESRYRILAEALPQIVMLADEDRRIVYVNRYYEQYTGISCADVASNWRQAIHPDDLPAVVQLRATGTSYEIEYRLRRASDGSYRWHFARVLSVPGDGNGVCWLAAAMDIDDRKRAEESLRFIEKAGTLLAQSLDLDTTFSTLLDLVIPDRGDWASISLRDEDGSVRMRVARHADPAKADVLAAICGQACFNLECTFGTPGVFRTGAPQLLAQVSIEVLQSAVKPPFVRAFEELGYGSLISLPIRFNDATIGSFTIVSAGGRRVYTQNDLPPLEELARRAGFAIGNARQYAREHRVARLLQDAALPQSLPRVPGLRFDAYYRAGRQEAAIGGDWYDALIVADGRVVVTIGDVAGSGLGAAVLMGSMRQVIRGAAHVDADPLTILRVADRALRSEHEDGLVTAFVGVIDPIERTLAYASAGHVPALFCTADGNIGDLIAQGLPLGCRELAPVEVRTAAVPRGSCLLLYTDGLVEWTHDIVAGDALLRRQFSANCRSGRASAKTLVDGVLAGADASDDVAVLIVTFD